MAESVEVLIKAENQASKVFTDVANDAERSIKRVKTAGEQAKKSTEFVGVIANSFGGSQIAGFAQQLAGLTEKMSQFSEVSKLGGAGATAFKVGVAGAAAAVGFQLGKALGDQLYKLTDFSKAIVQAGEDAKTAFSGLQAAMSRDLNFQMQEIELIRDPAEKKQQYDSLTKGLRTQIDDIAASIADSEAEVNKFEESYEAMLGLQDADRASTEALKAKLEGEKQILAYLKEQETSIKSSQSERAKDIALQKEQLALQDKSTEYIKGLGDEIAKLDAAAVDVIANLSREGNFTGPTAKLDQLKEELRLLEERKGLTAIREQAGQSTANDKDLQAAENLLVEIELRKTHAAILEEEARLKVKAKEDEAAALAKVAEQQQADAAKILSIRDAELAKLEEQEVLLKEGREAAKAFALEKQGLSKEDAKNIAAKEEELRRLEEEKNGGKQKMAKDTPTLQASESRLQTRGGGQDPQLVELRAMKNELKEQTIAAKETAKALNKGKATRIEMVGK